MSLFLLLLFPSCRRSFFSLNSSYIISLLPATAFCYMPLLHLLFYCNYLFLVISIVSRNWVFFFNIVLRNKAGNIDWRHHAKTIILEFIHEKYVFHTPIFLWAFCRVLPSTKLVSGNSKTWSKMPFFMTCDWFLVIPKIYVLSLWITLLVLVMIGYLAHKSERASERTI